MPQINLTPIITTAAKNGEGLLTDEQWKRGFDNATAGMRGIEKGEAEGRQMVLDQEARMDKANKQRLDGYKAMLADPGNAQAHAQMYGIEFTPTLQKMLQQPAMMQNIVMATEFAGKAGIKNPEAINKLMMQAASQAQQGRPFNPVEVFSSVQGMDMTEPMNPYQSGMLNVARTNAQTSRMNAERGGKAYQPWDDPRVPAELRIEGKMLAAEMQNSLMPEESNRKVQDYIRRVAPYVDGGQMPMNQPPTNTPAGDGKYGIDQAVTRSSNVPVGNFWGE